jgi:hypothetical protein
MDGIQLSIMEPDRGMRRAQSMGISQPFGGYGTSRGKPICRHPVGNGMLLLRDRSPSWIFTRFLTAAHRAIDARQLYRHGRDVLLRPGCSRAIAHCPVLRCDKADWSCNGCAPDPIHPSRKPIALEGTRVASAHVPGGYGITLCPLCRVHPPCRLPRAHSA